MSIALVLIAVFVDLDALSLMGVVTAIVFTLVIFEQVGSHVMGGCEDKKTDEENRKEAEGDV
jgi:hypothetical protein